MELLTWYGANINSQNSGGNTPLHISCVHGQEAAAIVLLRRGVNKDVLNNSNRSACQVAMISGNKHLAKRIEQHDENEVVKFSDRPSYNPRARPMSQLYQLCVTNKTAKKSTGNPTLSKLKQSEAGQSTDSLGASKFGSLKRSMFRGSAKKVNAERVRIRAVHNTANAYVVTRNYTPLVKEDLTLTIGDRIQVLFIGKEGFIEGICNGKQGWFPGICVELIDQNKPPQKKGKTSLYNSLKLKRIKIKRSSKGFGFSVRGATYDLDNYHPTPLVPSLQYVAQVDKAGAAEKAGLEVGHFILQINGQNVVTTPHNDVVDLVRNTKKVLEMTVTRSLPADNSSTTHPPPPPPAEVKKPEVPPRARPVQRIADSTASTPDLKEAKLRLSSQPLRDGRRLGHVNPMFLLQGGMGAITPPSTDSHEYATVNKDVKGETRVSSADKEEVYQYGEKQDSGTQLQSKSDTFLSKHSDAQPEDCAVRNSRGGSIEFSYESSSSNADMKTDSKVSDFTIESGYFYNSQGDVATNEQLAPETAMFSSEEIDNINTGAFYEYSETDNQFDYTGQNYYFDPRFSTASIENNKADSTFDDEGDFTPYERMSPEDEPPYDTFTRKDLYYTAPYEGEETYDRLNFGGQYFPNSPSDENTLEGDLTDDFDYAQFDNVDREPTEYDHMQTEEEFYQLVGNSYRESYAMLEGELGDSNADVTEGSAREINEHLSQFAKAVLEKSLTLKKRRSQQTESNSASESGSNLSLKNSEPDKVQESQTSDLGTDISSTYDTDNIQQQGLLDNMTSPVRDFMHLSDPDIPWEEQGGDSFDYLMHPPAHKQKDSSAKLIANTQHDLCVIGLRNITERSDSPSNQPDDTLDEYNPKHWKLMLKKVNREAPSKPDEAGEFVSRQLTTPESKSCDNIYSSNATSSLKTNERVTYTLEDEQTIAGRIPSIYSEELSPDYEDQYSYWREQLNTPKNTTKKSSSDSELSKLTASLRVVTPPQEQATAPKPNYSTFPGDPPILRTEEDITFEPYQEFTPTPLDIPETSPTFDYPSIPSPPIAQLLMPPPEGFDGIDPETLPPPPDLERSYNTDSFLPPPPSSLELHTMQGHDDTPPDDILYRMDLKHSRQFKQPSNWSTDEVGQWLESFGMEIYQSAFIDNDIQGSHLGLLSKEDLSALGITKLGHKMTILKEISKLHI